MKPPLSVIFFTLLSGAGLGLCAWMIILSLNPIYLQSIQQHSLILLGSSLFLITSGLISVFFHLANPKNVWRTLARLKTSWLSREILCSSLFYPFFISYLLCLNNIYISKNYLAWFAAPLLLIIFATIFCTSMMYRCLKTIPQWCTNLVPLNYFTLAAASGSFILWIIVQYKVPLLINITTKISALCFSIALITKSLYFNYINNLNNNKLTIQQATGIKHRLTQAVNSGHSSPNFIDKEFSFKPQSNLFPKLILVTLLLALILPLSAITFNINALHIMIMLIITTSVGFFSERWLFFAQAHHVVNLYKQHK